MVGDDDNVGAPEPAGARERAEQLAEHRVRLRDRIRRVGAVGPAECVVLSTTSLYSVRKEGRRSGGSASSPIARATWRPKLRTRSSGNLLQYVGRTPRTTASLPGQYCGAVRRPCRSAVTHSGSAPCHQRSSPCSAFAEKRAPSTGEKKSFASSPCEAGAAPVIRDQCDGSVFEMLTVRNRPAELPVARSQRRLGAGCRSM